MNKKLVRSVDLIFFCDEANGEYGLTHEETYDNNYGNGFNAAWDATMIFHDVFEHAHEYKNKYFKGDYAMNVGGEMAAMGSLCYYVYHLGLSERLKSNYDTIKSIINTTSSFLKEAISSGYCEYGDILLSNVPTQRPLDCYTTEDMLDQYCYELKNYNVKVEHYLDEKSRTFAFDYFNSISPKKIRDLHRYGFKMAERLVPDNNENHNILNDFYTFWSGFTKSNDPFEMNNIYNGITFNIYREKGIISWEAVFHIKSFIEVDSEGNELIEKIVGNKNGIKDYGRRIEQEVY